MENLSSLEHILKERTKELDCLYRIDEILGNLSLPLGEVMHSIAIQIEQAMQYNTLAQCFIIINNNAYPSNIFPDSLIKLRSKTIYENQQVEIIVYYTKPIHDERHPIFLPEEQKLLSSVCQRIAQYLHYRNIREQIALRNNQLNLPLSANLHQWLSSIGLKNHEIELCLRNPIIFKKGETLCKQNTSSNYILLVSEGYIKLFIEHFIEHNFIFKIVKPFDFIGLSTIEENAIFNFTASALTQVKAYIIDKSLYIDLIRNNKEFAHNMLNIFSRTCAFLLKRLNSIANKQSLGSLADSLLYLSEEIFNSPIIESFITRKDLAELSGISTENTVRMLSDLKNNQIINLNRNEIEIIDKPKLIKLSIHG